MGAGFGSGPLLVDRFVLQQVVGAIERGGLAVFDDWLDVMGLEKSAELVGAVPFVARIRRHLIEVSGQDLPTDLGVVWLLGRAVHVEDGARGTTDHQRGLQCFERIVRPGGVLPAGGDSIENAGVDHLDWSEIPEVAREVGELPPVGHVAAFFGVTDGREAREFVDRQAQSADDPGHLGRDIHELAVRMVEVFFQAV